MVSTHLRAAFIFGHPLVIIKIVRKFTLIFLLAIAVALVSYTYEAQGFGEKAGSCGGDCSECHSISIGEASELVTQIDPDVEVINVKQADVGGLWEVVFLKNGKRGIVYLNYGKSHIIVGKVLDVVNRENLTDNRLYDMNRIEVGRIALEDALFMGRKDAPHKLIVFDDPD